MSPSQIDTYRPNTSVRSRFERGAPPDRDRDVYFPNYDPQRRKTSNDYSNERGRGGSSNGERGMIDRRSRTRSNSPSRSLQHARQLAINFQRQDKNSREDLRDRSNNGGSWGRRRDGNYGDEQQGRVREAEVKVEGKPRPADSNRPREINQTHIYQDRHGLLQRGLENIVPVVSKNTAPGQQQDSTHLRRQASGTLGNNTSTPTMTMNQSGNFIAGITSEKTVQDTSHPQQVTTKENHGMKRVATWTPLENQLPRKTSRIFEASGHTQTIPLHQQLGQLTNFMGEQDKPKAISVEQLFQRPPNGNIHKNPQIIGGQLAPSPVDVDILLHDIHKIGLALVRPDSQWKFHRTYSEYPEVFETLKIYVKEVEHLREKVKSHEFTISQMKAVQPVVDPELKSIAWYEQQHQVDQKKIGDLFIQANKVPNMETKIMQLETKVASDEAAKLMSEEEKKQLEAEKNDAKKQNAVWGLMCLRAGGVDKLEEAVNRSYVDGMRELQISKPEEKSEAEPKAKPAPKPKAGKKAPSKKKN